MWLADGWTSRTRIPLSNCSFTGSEIHFDSVCDSWEYSFDPQPKNSPPSEGEPPLPVCSTRQLLLPAIFATFAGKESCLGCSLKGAAVSSDRESLPGLPSDRNRAPLSQANKRVLERKEINPSPAWKSTTLSSVEQTSTSQTWEKFLPAIQTVEARSSRREWSVPRVTFTTRVFGRTASGW